jgi:hypothetical protein
VELFSVDFQDCLDSSVTLTGTPTVAEVDGDDDAVKSPDLTIANIAVNTSALTIENRAVAVGEAIQFLVSGQQDGESYRLKMTATTDTTPAQTKVKYLRFQCENE